MFPGFRRVSKGKGDAAVKKPEFHLQRVTEDGCDEPVVYPVQTPHSHWQLDRRGLLGAGIALGSLVVGASGEAAPAAQTAPLLRAHKTLVSGLEFFPDGRLVSTSLDGTLKIWEVNGGRLLHTVTDNDPIFSVATDPNALRCAWATSEGMVFVSEEIEEDSELQTAGKWETNHGKVFGLEFDPLQDELLTGGEDGSVRLWSIDRRRLSQTFDLSSDARKPHAVFDVAMHPRNRILVATTAEGMTAVAPDDRQVHSAFHMRSAAYGVAIARTGEWCLVCCHRRGMAQFHFDEPGQANWLKGLRQSGPVFDVAVAPDCRTVVAAGADKKMYFVTVEDGRVTDRKSVSGHRSPVYRLAISPNGRWAVSGDADGVIVLWDLAKKSAVSLLFDPEATGDNVKGGQYTKTDSRSQRTVTYTVPCGTPIPSGARCVCNCVPGAIRVPRPVVSRPVPAYRPPVYRPPVYYPVPYIPSTGSYCTCNKVCTCIPVFR